MATLMDFKTVTVEEFTTPSPLTVSPKKLVREVAQMMRDQAVRHIPVVENGKAIGIISDRDVKLAASFNGSSEFLAEEVMTPEPYTVAPETSLEEVALEMSRHKYGCAIVQYMDGKIYGVFTSTDALNALVEVLRGDF